MSEIAGTVKSVTLLRGPDNQSATNRYTYHLTFDAATTTAGDTSTVTSIATVVNSFTKSGKTLTLRDATVGHPGVSAGGTAVYANTITVATADVDFSLGGPTAAAAVAGCLGVGLICVLDEASA